MHRHCHDELEVLKDTLLAMGGGLVEDHIRRVMPPHRLWQINACSGRETCPSTWRNSLTP